MPLSSPKIAPKPAAETTATGTPDADIAAKHKKELAEKDERIAELEKRLAAMATAVAVVAP